MRRMAPPPRLRVHKAACSPVCVIEPGPDGLRLRAVAPPAGLTIVPAPPIAPVVAAPYPTPAMHATAGGRILLTWGPGFARTVLAPELAQAFDRRPPGLTEAIGAAEANAGLLHADDGWRAVVLPSMGDRLPGLGAGPVAIAPDGLRVAVADGDHVVEMAIGDGAELGRHEGPARALAYGAGGLLHIARPGADDDVVRLVAASAGSVALARYADGTLGPWPSDAAARWASPVGEPHTIALTADGAWAALAGSSAVAVVRAADGAVAAHISGATAIALTTGGRIAVGGEWGLALIEPVEEQA